MPPSEMTDCPECGRRIGAGSVVCPYCGTVLKEGGLGGVVGDALPLAEEESTWEGLSAPSGGEGPAEPAEAREESFRKVEEPSGPVDWLVPEVGPLELPPPEGHWPSVGGDFPPGDPIARVGTGVDPAAPTVALPDGTEPRFSPVPGEPASSLGKPAGEPAEETPEEITDEMAAEADLPPAVVEKIRRYEKLVAENATKASPYILLGRACEDAGLKERAIEVYGKLLEIDPRNQTAHTRLDVLRGTITPMSEAGETLLRRAPSIRVRGPVDRAWRPGRAFLGIAGAAVLLVAAVVVKHVYFPRFFRPVSDDYSSSGPVWSPEGTRLSVTTSIRTGDMMATGGRFYQSWLAIVSGRKRGILQQFDRRQYSVGGGGSVSWAPDGRALVMASYDDEGPAIYHLDLATKAKKRLVSGGSAEYSRDGKKMVYVYAEPWRGYAGEYGTDSGMNWEERENVYVYDFATGESAKVTQHGAENPRFSPDGRKILYETDRGEWTKERGVGWTRNERGDEVPVDRDYGRRETVGRDLHVVDIATGEDTAITSEGYNVHGAWVGPAGKWVSYANYAGRERREREETAAGGAAGEGGEAKKSEPPSENLREMFGRGWRRMGGGDLKLVGAEGGDEKTVLSASRDHVADLEDVSWAPDGSFVAFEGLVEEKDVAAQYMAGVAKQLTGDEKVDIFFVNADGTRKRRFENRHAYKRNPRISPDGKRIAYELMLFEIRLASFDYATEVWVDRLP